MSFAIDINKFALKCNATLNETSRAIKISLFSSVIEDTRVDTGRLRGNWSTTTGKPAWGELDRLDPTGIQAITEVKRTVKGDTVDYLTNNLPYSEVYEEKDGMIAKNMVRLQRIVKESVA